MSARLIGEGVQPTILRNFVTRKRKIPVSLKRTGSVPSTGKEFGHWKCGKHSEKIAKTDNESMETEEITAPFTLEQVEHLNCYQESRAMHPFTCGIRSEHRDNEGILIATETGWHCPAQGCEYTQDWAPLFMAPQHWSRSRFFHPAKAATDTLCACQEDE